jgi:L-2-hydroxyglutarate oxidase LhgO
MSPLARRLSGRRLPARHHAKGNYYALAGRSPFSRLVYPLPESRRPGVHLTLDLGGQARFGPDVEWLPTRAGPADSALRLPRRPERADAFAAEIRRYWPGCRQEALAPAYAGIRPKIAGRSAPAGDFLIQGPAQHGIPGLVNLFGIESPGLTACLAIADRVASPNCWMPAENMRAVLDTNIVLDLLHFADPQTQALQRDRARRLRCFTDRDCLAELQAGQRLPAVRLDAAAQGAARPLPRFVIACERERRDRRLPLCRAAATPTTRSS